MMTRINRIWTLFCKFVLMGSLLIGGMGACQPTPDLPNLPYADDLQHALEDVIRNNQTDFPLGISAAVIVPAYKPWTGVSGTSHDNVPISPDMLFDAGSIAKMFEAALALKFAEAGNIALDDSVSKYLPEYPHIDSGITVRQLLNHTSGVFNVFEHPDFPWVGPDIDYSRSWTMEEVFDQFVTEPYGPPGDVQHYSSTNYLLLTAILQRASGASISGEIERHFLQPLQLEHTVLSLGEPPGPGYLVAHPWVDTDRDGVLEDLHAIPLTWKATLIHPVLFSTASDLARWVHALLHEQIVLAPDSYKEMLTFPEVRVQDSDGARYGLGVADFSAVLGKEAIGHGGSSLGYSAAVLYLPESGVSIVWLVNTGESPVDLANRIMIDAWLSLSRVIMEN